MEMKKSSRIAIGIMFFLFLVGCAGPVVRDATKVDMSLPVGQMQGNQFVGIRYPFKLTVPPGWQASSEYPNFMLQLGFDKEGLEDSQVFVFNPETQSNLQIDFSPAGRYAKFDQKNIEWLTTTAEGSFKEEFEKEFGKGGRFTLSTTQPYSLKGVPYAAKNFGTYSRRGVKTEHGWIYAFAEPYQIFIIYMVLEKEGKNDHQDMKAIIDSFEYSGKK
jgi:hypothetical protein